MLRAIRCLFLSMAVVLSWGMAQAAPIIYTGVLEGSQEVPPNGSPATGFSVVAFDAVANTLFVDVIFNGLLAPTTAGHIHAPAPPGFVAPIAIPFTNFPLGVPAGHYINLFDLSLPTTYDPQFLATFGGGNPQLAELALGTFLDSGLAYVNVHTTLFPGGEIRGQLAEVAPIPEPASILLLGSGLAAAALRRRARRG